MKMFGKVETKEPDMAAEIEKDVNSWLEQNPKIKVVDIKQTSNGGSFQTSKMFISVWYEEAE